MSGERKTAEEAARDFLHEILIHSATSQQLKVVKKIIQWGQSHSIDSTDSKGEEEAWKEWASKHPYRAMIDDSSPTRSAHDAGFKAGQSHPFPEVKGEGSSKRWLDAHDAELRGRVLDEVLAFSKIGCDHTQRMTMDLARTCEDCLDDFVESLKVDTKGDGTSASN